MKSIRTEMKKIIWGDQGEGSIRKAKKKFARKRANKQKAERREKSKGDKRSWLEKLFD